MGSNSSCILLSQFLSYVYHLKAIRYDKPFMQYCSLYAKSVVDHFKKRGGGGRKSKYTSKSRRQTSKSLPLINKLLQSRENNKYISTTKHKFSHHSKQKEDPLQTLRPGSPPTFAEPSSSLPAIPQGELWAALPLWEDEPIPMQADVSNNYVKPIDPHLHPFSCGHCSSGRRQDPIRPPKRWMIRVLTHSQKFPSIQAPSSTPTRSNTRQRCHPL